MTSDSIGFAELAKLLRDGLISQVEFDEYVADIRGEASPNQDGMALDGATSAPPQEAPSLQPRSELALPSSTDSKVPPAQPEPKVESKPASSAVESPGTPGAELEPASFAAQGPVGGGQSSPLKRQAPDFPVTGSGQEELFDAFELSRALVVVVILAVVFFLLMRF